MRAKIQSLSSFTLLLIIILFVSPSSLAAPTVTNTINIPTSLPNSDRDYPVSPSFIGFAFEQAAFYNYSFTSAGEPNTFSANLISSVLERTGGTPIIRVGGTSGDRAHFNASQSNATNYPATEGGTHFKAPWLSIGKPYFQAFEQFDSIGAKYIFQVPWDRAGVWRWKEEGYQNALAWARAGMDIIGTSRLQALEIGNEPNFYLPNQAITAEQYGTRYKAFQSALLERLPELANRRIFQALDIADKATSAFPAKPFFTTGGLNAIALSLRQVAFHYYQAHGINNRTDLQAFVRHSTTAAELAVFVPSIAYLRKHHPGISLILSEVGDNVGADATKAPIYNVLATALWRVDFMLHAMSLGIAGVNWQQIFNERISMWLPVDSERAGKPRVTANYYALPFAAEFVGRGGQTKVVEQEVGDDGEGTLVAYAAYDAGKLARVAAMNLDVWQPEDGQRTSAVFRLKVSDGQTTVQIRGLNSADGALAKKGISWAGLQWTWENQGRPQEEEQFETKRSGSKGVVEIEVEASSAVLVTLA